uniref:Protein TIC 214 n=1 Tax=Acorus tatarinowii TaxID=123564 RepID=A0A649WI85_9LILI|nr:hypothetical chloroplast RF1 [Acorus tatarinowii]QGK88162.1 hypothetical chloroplast RF1 [Acorus tatarinowii]
MIFKSFLLGNLGSLYIKIINSVVVVGLYYGFLTTFSIGPSYFFLLRARIMEEGTKREVSATTGFITGQLMMFISIYYAPLHLALGRPHTITVLVIPYLLFHFFSNNQKQFFDYGSTTRNSMRNLSIQCVFLTNLIFQLFNHLMLPSSTLARLVNIYMFRCNNKMLFVTSSFVGWLIGHILFMKWVGLVVSWIRQNHSIRSNVLIRSNKYLGLKLKSAIAQILSIIFFIACVNYLARLPDPSVTKKLNETSKTETEEEESQKSKESEEERDVEKETTSETKETKQEQEGSTEQDPSPYWEEKEDPDKIDETEEIRVNGKEKKKDEFRFHFKETDYKRSPGYENSYLDGYQDNWDLQSEEEEESTLGFEKPLVTCLFDYKRWNRPFRYIKNKTFENAIRDEMSQYFFYTCLNNGKKKISFTYPPSLATFSEIIERKMSLYTTKKLTDDDLYSHWVSNNEEKKNNLSNELINRIKVLDKGSLAPDVLEKRTRLCDDENEQECLPKKYDPLLNGSYRGRIKKLESESTRNDSIISAKGSLEKIWKNKINGLIIITNDSREFEHQIDPFDGESLSAYMTHSLTSISKLSLELVSTFHFEDLALLTEQKRIDFENQTKRLKFLFDVITADANNQTIENKFIEIEKIDKKIPRWVYKLISEEDYLAQQEQQEEENEEEAPLDFGIRSRKGRRVVIYTDKKQNRDQDSNPNTDNSTTDNTTTENDNSDTGEEIALIRYAQQSDFSRDLINGSIRAKRRKIVLWEMLQANVHSPLFLDQVAKMVSFDLFDHLRETMNLIFRNWIRKEPELQILDSEEQEDREKLIKIREEDERIIISETWDNVMCAQAIRGCMLVTHSFIRKYIILPLLIIAKNIGRILLFQLSEWDEDFKDWNREMHVKCTYNGVQLSETEFPQNWLKDGIQIKILFPFSLKPWRESKATPSTGGLMKEKKRKNDDFCFLTVWGMEAELPFGPPRKRPSFFKPIFEELDTNIRKVENQSFILKEKTKDFLKKKTGWVTKIVLLKNKIRNFFTKVNPNLLFGLKKVYEPSENQKDSIISNKITHESTVQIPSSNWTNYSPIEKKMKDLSDRTITTGSQIERITKDKQKGFLTSDINIRSNETSSNAKRTELQKDILRIAKKRSIRFIRKLHSFVKSFIERIYLDIFLCTINIPRINLQLFFESIKKILNKSISNDERNKEKIDETNQNTIHFISTIRNSFSNSNLNNKSKIYWDFSLLSQAYVLYKLSQTQVIKRYQLKSVLQYHRAYPFLKDRIKDLFGTPRIVHAKSRPKKLPISRINAWKNWLRDHYQYNLSRTRWSELVPKKWREKFNQRRIKNKYSRKLNSFEKEKNQQAHYAKEISYVVDSLSSQKVKLKKDYRYDLLSHKYINSNYEDREYSDISRLSLQVNGDREIPYDYNRQESNYVLVGLPISDYLGEEYFIGGDKNSDRKYFDWRILRFDLRKDLDIKTQINRDTETNMNKNGTDNYQVVGKKNPFSLPIHQEINSSKKKKQKFFDWVGMREEILYRPISNLEPWFFPEFVLRYDAYKNKPRIVSIKSLLLDSQKDERNEIISKTKNINKKTQKKDLSNQKKHLKVENQEKKDFRQVDLRPNPTNQRDPVVSDTRNQQKDIEEDSVGSGVKKRRKKKKFKSKKEAELDFFLKKYLLFQLRWDELLNTKMMTNIKVYCLLLRLKNLKEIAISSIERGEMCLDLMLMQKDLSLRELIKKGIFIIEPIRLSRKWDGKLIMYQTIGISLVDENQDPINIRCRKKGYADENSFNKSVRQQEKMLVDRDENDYDLLVPENILSPRRRRELRILICFNSRNESAVDGNSVFYNNKNVESCRRFLDEDKHLDTDAKKFMKFKFFLWPNYRLEDLACMNRYWFDTTNGSRFSMLRIHMYPRFLISWW